MATKTIKAWIDGSVQDVSVEDLTSPEQMPSYEDRIDTLEDKHEVIVTDGNLLVGNGTDELEEMTPEEALSHIGGASIMTLTTAEFEALGDDEINANTLYIPIDSDNVDIYVQNNEPTNVEEGALWVDMDAEGSVGSVSGSVGFDATAYGLPVLYLTGDTTGISEDDAVSLEYVFGEQSGSCTLKWQGSSSLAYPKKNYTIKFDNAFEAATGWGEQKKYCLKANYIDFSHARNIVSAKLWGEIVRTRTNVEQSVEELFDISKITHFTNMNGETIAWYYIDGETLVCKSSVYNGGYAYAVGQTYPTGEYTVSFDVYNNNNSDTDNITTIVAGFGVGDNVSEGLVEFTAKGEWVHYDINVTNTVADSQFYIMASYGVGNHTTDLQFKNVSITTQGSKGLGDLVNCGAIDGFPVCVYINGQYAGLYTFNIPKDGWMFGMGSRAQECILCANNHSAATRFEAAALCDGTDFEIEYITDETDTAWAVESVNTLISAVMNSDGTDIDSTIAKYLDIESAIDFYIFTALQTGCDNVDKNYLLSTYDGVKWFFSTYDMDSTFGNQWTGKGYDSAKSAPTLLDFSNKVMQLVRDYKTVAVKARYNQLRNTVLSEDNVLLAFENFMAGIPSALYEQDTKLWPLIPGTKTNNIAQIANNYRLRVQLLDAQIEQLESAITYTNLVPTATDPQTGEIYNGVGYKEGVNACAPEYGYEENWDGFITTGLVSFPAYSVTDKAVIPYISPVLYVKGNISFDDTNTRIVSYQKDGSYCHQTNYSGFVDYYNVEELSEGYYKITYKTETAASGVVTIDSWTGKYPEKVQLSMKGTGEGLIVTLGEPIE